MSNHTLFPSTEAQWIWTDNFDDAAAPGQFVLFRKTFDVPDDVLSSTSTNPILLHVTADTRYRLLLNGNSISFGPSKSNLQHWIYETVDIRPNLCPGRNVLTATVLRYSNTHPGCLSMVRSSMPGFLLACKIADQVIHTDTAWKTRKDESVHIAADSEWDARLGPQFLGINERVDGRLALSDWKAVGYDDSDWPAAIISSPTRLNSPMLDPRRLFPREIPALTEDFARFDSVVTASDESILDSWNKILQGGDQDLALAVPANTTMSVIIQCDKLVTGFVDLLCNFSSSDSTEAPTIDILYSECFEASMDNGNPRTKGDRTDYKNGVLYGSKDVYIPHGKSVNHYSPFWWRTFRYIQITITTKNAPLDITSFTYRSTYFPLEVTTTISTSSNFVTRLWDVSLHTLRCCMHETYEDCPYYEQNQFIMDARSQILFTYLVARGDDRLARKTMQEFYASRRDDGLLDTYFPNRGGAINIPTFSLYWVLMVHDHMVYIGDEKLARRYFGTVDGILHYFDDRLDDHYGLVGAFDADCWPYVDWVQGWFTPGLSIRGVAVPPAYYRYKKNGKPGGCATFHSLLYAYTLLKAAELCVFLGRHDTAREYFARHSRIVHAVQKHCYDPESGFFLDGPSDVVGTNSPRSQHVQIFAVLAGCVSGTNAQTLMRRTILERAEHKLAKASFSLAFYLFRAASEAGVYEECWPALIAPWEAMLQQNLTTWAESESMVRSDCHGWSAVPLYEITCEIMGIQYRSKPYLDRVLGQDDIKIQVQIAPKKSLVEDMAITIGLPGSDQTSLSMSWKDGGEIVLGTSTDQVVRMRNQFGWMTQSLKNYVTGL
ncbi:hypothetical protein SEUCBS139899_003379 [Sporothrix eucalyptigena]|uniref:Alpha-L-rhamnosidase six-hairpin glycosidase domain-containing protein n=1 Tax=Sporothrix eucalyptigena TaxID=1812306 RepID=A0ABP0C4J4_9PEZI